MDHQHGPAYLSLIFTGVATCTAGACLAMALISQCTRSRQPRKVSEAEKAHREERARIMAYEARYFDQLSEAKEQCGDVELTEEELKVIGDATVDEETPVGRIKMGYDVGTETFRYYTDARNVGYKVLDAVARSFCLTHDCPQLCVHYYDEFTRAKAKALERRKEEERHAAEEEKRKEGETSDEGEGCSTEESSVFAKFKTYNARASKPVKERARILTANANRFCFKGRITDLEAQLETESRRVRPADPGMSFRDFKRTVESKED